MVLQRKVLAHRAGRTGWLASASLLQGSVVLCTWKHGAREGSCGLGGWDVIIVLERAQALGLTHTFPAEEGASRSALTFISLSLGTELTHTTGNTVTEIEGDCSLQGCDPRSFYLQKAWAFSASLPPFRIHCVLCCPPTPTQTLADVISRVQD